MAKIEDPAFFRRDADLLAEALLGKLLCRQTPEGEILRLRISETEAYGGTEDSAAHVHRGRTKRTEVFYREGGTLYVYLCYGIHRMLNIIAGESEDPQGVLIRSCVGVSGPGRVGKTLSITADMNGKSILNGELWLEDDGFPLRFHRSSRVGIDYAEKRDRMDLRRYILDTEESNNHCR